MFKSENNKKVYVAFYKGIHKWYSYLIRWWTKSIYSHCEIWVSGDPINNSDKGIRYGITDDNDVTALPYVHHIQMENNPNWDLVEIPEEHHEIVLHNVQAYYDKTKGAKYNWRGIFLSCIFNRKEGSPKRYTCSEWIVGALDGTFVNVNPKWYTLFSPEDVYQLVITTFKKGGR